MNWISDYTPRFDTAFGNVTVSVWQLPGRAASLITARMSQLPGEFEKRGDALIHRSAIVEEHVVMKGPIIVGPRCFIGAHAYLRGGVFLDDDVVVGPGCEVKSSYILRGSALAHFNFVGDSILGEHVNLEAGSVIANHYNERSVKTIYARMSGTLVELPVQKFGALVGDGCKIGANAVLSPGTILPPRTIVPRLALIEQVAP